MREITIEEMEQVVGAVADTSPRYYDSTDYVVAPEMSTADYEWLMSIFEMDVRGGMNHAVSGAQTQAEADMLAAAYINSIGLGDYVQVNPTINDPVTGEEYIIVTGERDYEQMTLSFGVFDPILAFSSSLAAGTIADIGPGLDEGNLTIELHPSLGTLTPEEQAAIDKLINEFYIKTGYLQNIDGSFTLTDNATVTGTDLLSIFPLVDFVIYPVGYNHGNGGAGRADYNNGNPVLHINVDQLVTNMSTDDLISWYFFHELSHMTAAGQEHNAAMYLSSSPGGTERTQDEFLANERYANNLASAIATASGNPFSPGFIPPAGYSGTVTYSGSAGDSGDDGSGGTGGGGFGGGGGGGDYVP